MLNYTIIAMLVIVLLCIILIVSMKKRPPPPEKIIELPIKPVLHAALPPQQKHQETIMENINSMIPVDRFTETYFKPRTHDLFVGEFNPDRKMTYM